MQFCKEPLRYIGSVRVVGTVPECGRLVYYQSHGDRGVCGVHARWFRNRGVRVERLGAVVKEVSHDE